MEQLQYTIGDHERTILKFRETVRTMQVNILINECREILLTSPLASK